MALNHFCTWTIATTHSADCAHITTDNQAQTKMSDSETERGRNATLNTPLLSIQADSGSAALYDADGTDTENRRHVVQRVGRASPPASYGAFRHFPYPSDSEQEHEHDGGNGGMISRYGSNHNHSARARASFVSLAVKPNRSNDRSDRSDRVSIEEREKERSRERSRHDDRTADDGDNTVGDNEEYAEEKSQHDLLMTVSPGPTTYHSDMTHEMRPSKRPTHSKIDTDAGVLSADESPASGDENATFQQMKFMRRGLKHLKPSDRVLLKNKKKIRREKRAPQTMEVTTHAVAKSFRLSDMLTFFHKNAYKFRQFTDVIHIRERGHGHIFVFLYGCVIFWNIDEKRTPEVLDMLTKFADSPVAEPETDDFDFVIGTESAIKTDLISLSSDNVMEKLAVSFALAQSVKLSVFEESVETQIEKTKHLPEELARYGRISLTSKQISQQIGALFIERNDVNLTSDILDTPEFFWENDEFLSFFNRLTKYLEIDKRVSVLNSRLDVMKELLDMLGAESNQRHATKLEWIIIILICLEAVLQLMDIFLSKPLFGGVER